MANITGTAFAEQARSSKYDNIKYKQADCQKFVEMVLKDCGVRKPDGKLYDWKGVNSMWRTAFTWKGTITEAKKVFGCIPLGAWLIHWVDDGGEKERGYFDGLGNAKHIGIYTETPGLVRDSTTTKTRDGVGYRDLSGFNYVCLPFMIDYVENNLEPIKEEKPSKDDALKALETVKLYILKG